MRGSLRYSGIWPGPRQQNSGAIRSARIHLGSLWRVSKNTFAEALDAAERFDDDAQAELIAVFSRRLTERGRERVAATMTQARREFAAGQCQPMTATEVVREAQH